MTQQVAITQDVHVLEWTDFGECPNCGQQEHLYKTDDLVKHTFNPVGFLCRSCLIRAFQEEYFIETRPVSLSQDEAGYILSYYAGEREGKLNYIFDSLVFARAAGHPSVRFQWCMQVGLPGEPIEWHVNVRLFGKHTELVFGQEDAFVIAREQGMQFTNVSYLETEE